MNNIAAIIIAGLISLASAIVSVEAGQYVRDTTPAGNKVFIEEVNPGLVRGRCLLKWINSPDPNAYDEMWRRFEGIAGCTIPWAPGWIVVVPTGVTDDVIDRAYDAIDSGQAGTVRVWY